MNEIGTQLGWDFPVGSLPNDLHDAIPLGAKAWLDSRGKVVLELPLWLPLEGGYDQLLLTFYGCADSLPAGLIGADLHTVRAAPLEGNLLVLFVYGNLYERCLVLCERLDARLLADGEKLPVPWDEETGRYAK